MRKEARQFCIVGAIVAVVFALAAPSFACDGCDQVQQVRVYEQPQQVRLRVIERERYVQPEVIREQVIVREPVRVAKVLRIEHDHYADVQQVVRVEKIKQIREPIRLRRQKSKVVQKERIVQRDY